MTESAPVRLADRPGFGALMVAIASIAFGLIPLFARSLTEAGIAPPAVSMFRYLLSLMVFLPFLRIGGALGRATLWGYCSGLVVGAGWVGYVAALTRMPVPVAGVLYMTYPMFILAVGWLFFRDRPHPRALLGGLMILAAAVLVAEPAIRAQSGADWGLREVLLALAAPLGFGLGVNVLTHKLVALPPPSRIAAFSLGSVTGLLPLVSGLPADQVIPSNLDEWLLVLGLSLVTALLPQMLYTTFVPKIGAAKSGALGAIELPTMFLIGWSIMGDTVGLREAFAGCMVMAAILLTPAKEARPTVAVTTNAIDSPPPTEERQR